MITPRFVPLLVRFGLGRVGARVATLESDAPVILGRAKEPNKNFGWTLIDEHYRVVGNESLYMVPHVDHYWKKYFLLLCTLLS